MAEESKERGLVKYQSRGQEVKLSTEIVRNYLVTGKRELVNDQEIVHYLAICKARSLNPFVRDCYLIKYDQNPAQIIVSIDFYRSRAKAQPDCVGWEAGVICQEKKTKELRYSHGLVLETEEVVGGWFKAQPKGWDTAFLHEVNLKEYRKTTSDGKITKFWQNAAMMIAKVAESQGLRRAWPDTFQGIHTAEEMGLEEKTLDITPIEIEEPKPLASVDLTEWDTLIAAKELSPERLAMVEEFVTRLAETAKGATPAIVKDRAAKNFEGPAIPAVLDKEGNVVTKAKHPFWGAFEAWEKDQIKETLAAAAAKPTATPAATGEAGVAVEEPGERPETNECFAHGEYEGDECPKCAQESASERTFEKRHEKVIDVIMKACIPLADLAKVQVQNLKTDITVENIDAVEKMAADFTAPKKGHTKK